MSVLSLKLRNGEEIVAMVNTGFEEGSAVENLLDDFFEKNDTIWLLNPSKAIMMVAPGASETIMFVPWVNTSRSQSHPIARTEILTFGFTKPGIKEGYGIYVSEYEKTLLAEDEAYSKHVAEQKLQEETSKRGKSSFH